MRMRLIAVLVFAALASTASAQCGLITLNPTTGLLDCIGPSSAPTISVSPYSTSVSAQTSVSITAATHGFGALATYACWDSSTPRLAVQCSATRNTSGDLVFTFDPAFTGLIQIGTASAAGSGPYPSTAGIVQCTGTPCTAWGTSYTTAGSGTVVALATSPTFVTPVLGVASGTSLALGGATIGSNALAVTGTVAVSSTVSLGSVIDSASAQFGLAGGGVGGVGLRLGSSLVAAWNSASNLLSGSLDTSLSRISAGIVGVGTGAAGSFAGTLKTTGLLVQGVPTFNGTNTTGAGTALLGTNSPASTNSAPYTWVQITTSDGSTAYVPAWK